MSSCSQTLASVGCALNSYLCIAGVWGRMGYLAEGEASLSQQAVCHLGQSVPNCSADPGYQQDGINHQWPAAASHSTATGSVATTAASAATAASYTACTASTVWFGSRQWHAAAGAATAAVYGYAATICRASAAACRPNVCAVAHWSACSGSCLPAGPTTAAAAAAQHTNISAA